MSEHPVEASYSAALNDKYIQTNIGCASKYLLGQESHARRIRDVNGVLLKYIDLGVTCWSYWALLLKLLLLGLNGTAIFFAFITYKSPEVKEWRFVAPTRVVVWVEFLGYCYYLLWFIWYTLHWIWCFMRELCGGREDAYKRSLETCTAARQLYKAAMKLEFNLFLFLRYVSPPAVMAGLARARRRVYAKYGTRVHRENCCLDLCCCCCFYGRLCICSLFQSLLVLVCMAVSLMAVFIKILQLRFLGSENINTWSVMEILLFGQFVVNLICLDTRELSKRKAKLQFLFFGADAEEAAEERAALKLIENLALLVLRNRYSLLTALVIHHSITADDISYLYIHDELEEDRPRNAVRHQQYKDSHSTSGGGTSDGESGMPHTAAAGAAAIGGSAWGAYAQDSNAIYQEGRHSRPSYSPQVIVEMSPSRGGRGPAQQSSSFDLDLPLPPSLAAPPPPPQAMYASYGSVSADRSKRFPYDFYSQGHAVGVPLRGSYSRPQGGSGPASRPWGA